MRRFLLYCFIIFGICPFSASGSVKEIRDHNLSLKKDLYYVQIGIFTNGDALLHIRNDYNIITYKNPKGQKVFIAGGFEKINPARSLQDTLIKLGFPDAFIVLLKAAHAPPKIQEKKAALPVPAAKPAERPALKKPLEMPKAHVEKLHPAKKIVKSKPKPSPEVKPVPAQKVKKHRRGKRGIFTSVKPLWIAVFIMGIISFLMILGLILTRRYHILQARKFRNLSTRFQAPLSSIMFDSEYDFDIATETGKKEAKALFQADLEIPENRQVLIDTIMLLHRNLAGETATRLESLFVSLGLAQDSLDKLDSRNWFVIARGICEISQMRVEDSYGKVLELTTHPATLVRSEAQLCVIKFTKQLPITFLDQHVYPLAEWEQLNILETFLRLDTQDVPDFSRFLYSTNIAIVAFAIRMICFFKQLNAAGELKNFLGHKNTEIKLETLKTLRELEETSALPAILQEINSGSKAIRMEAIKAVGHLGDKNEVSILESLFKEHEEHDILLASALALKAIGKEGDAALDRIKKTENPHWNKIIAHVRDSRIN